MVIVDLKDPMGRRKHAMQKGPGPLLFSVCVCVWLIMCAKWYFIALHVKSNCSASVVSPIASRYA